MDTSTVCPGCGIGTLFIDEQGAVGRTVHTGYQLASDVLKVVMVRTPIAFCNTCEFSHEIAV